MRLTELASTFDLADLEDTVDEDVLKGTMIKRGMKLRFRGEPITMVLSIDEKKMRSMLHAADDVEFVYGKYERIVYEPHEKVLYAERHVEMLGEDETVEFRVKGRTVYACTKGTVAEVEKRPHSVNVLKLLDLVTL